MIKSRYFGENIDIFHSDFGYNGIFFIEGLLSIIPGIRRQNRGVGRGFALDLPVGELAGRIEIARSCWTRNNL